MNEPEPVLPAPFSARFRLCGRMVNCAGIRDPQDASGACAMPLIDGPAGTQTVPHVQVLAAPSAGLINVLRAASLRMTHSRQGTTNGTCWTLQSLPRLLLSNRQRIGSGQTQRDQRSQPDFIRLHLPLPWIQSGGRAGGRPSTSGPLRRLPDSGSCDYRNRFTHSSETRRGVFEEPPRPYGDELSAVAMVVKTAVP